MKKKIGLITYHAAYNYGSMLQAYALQKYLVRMDYNAEIINYRFQEQKKYYGLYRIGYGLRIFLFDLMMFPQQKQRKKRIARFERFLSEKMQITKEYSKPDDLNELSNKYDIYISGSDQILNKHSNELEHVDWEYMNPYLLTFTDRKKISYATSLATMTESDLCIISDNIKKFSALSARENEAKERLEKIVDKDVVDVLDPTFLLTKEQWDEELPLGSYEYSESYILIYSLAGTATFKKYLDAIYPIARKMNKQIRIIAPYAYFSESKDTISNQDAGPIEFLKLLRYADAVYTDSYHGTILSINFEKDIYSICKGSGSDNRKTEILERIGLQNRIITHIENIEKIDFEDIDYADINFKIDELRQNSYRYIRDNL